MGRPNACVQGQYRKKEEKNQMIFESSVSFLSASRGCAKIKYDTIVTNKRTDA